MKTDKERMLNDVLHDEAYQAFRAELYEQAAAEVRSRRGRARQHQLLAVAACLLTGLGLMFLLRPGDPGPAGAGASVATLRTQPILRSQIVTTLELEAELVSTARERRAPIVVVRTEPTTPSVDSISDQELLRMFPGRALALVQNDSGRKRLLFLDATETTSPFEPAGLP